MKKELLLIFLLAYLSGFSQTVINTSFDDYSPGTLDGVNLWSMEESGTATVVSDAAYIHSGNQGVKLASSTAAKVELQHLAYDKTETGLSENLYLDCWVKLITPTTEESLYITAYDLLPSSSAKRSCVFEFTENSILRVYDGSSKVEVQSSYYTIGEWTRLSARIDFSTATLEVAINGNILDGPMDFRDTYTPTDLKRDTDDKEYHLLRFNHKADISDIAIDDIYVGTTAIADIAFAAPSTTRTITVEQPDLGIITLSPEQEEYELGDTVWASISDIPEHYTLDTWTGSFSGTTNPVEIIMDANMTIGASVIVDDANPPTSYNITLTQTTGGTISVSPESGPYYEGSTVTLTATPDLAYDFSSWNGITGTTTSVEITLSEDLTVSAVFTEGTFEPRTIHVSTIDDFDDALDGLQAGDEIILANGTYTGKSTTLNNVKGTSEYPILIRAEEIGGVTLNDEFFLDFRTCEYITIQGFNINLKEKSTTLKVQASNNIRITQNVFDGIGEPAYNDGDTTDRNSSTWIILQGSWDDDVTLSHHNRIDNNVFKNKVTLGNMIRIDGTNQLYVSQYDVIENNHFKNMGPRADNEMEAIRIGWSAMSESDGYCRVSNNLFEECNGDPEIISVKCNKNEISHNTFRGCEGTVSLRHGNETVVDGNFFFGDDVEGSGGVRIYGSDHRIINNYFEGLKGTKWDAPITLTEGDAEEGSSGLSSHFRIERAIIANNTLINNDYGIEIGYDNVGKYSKPARDVVMAYNIIKGESNTLVNYINTPDNMTWIGNVMYAGSDATIGTGVTFDATQVSVQEPNLVYNSELGYYKASAQTPSLTLDNTLVGDIDYDVDGQMRSASTNYGADEFSSSAILYQPLLSSDVGPSIGDYLETSVIDLGFTRSGESKALRISTNLAWTISSTSNWITLSATSGTGEESIDVTASENTTGYSRSASITITTSGADDAELTQVINITQDATDPDTLLLETNTVNFTATDSTAYVTLACNTSWVASSNVDWLTVLPTSGSGDADLELSVTANTSVVSRQAIISVSITGSLSDSIMVSQAGIFGDEKELDIITAVASTEQNETGKVNIAANVLDKDFDTRWSGEGIGAYIDLTLSDVSKISYIKVGHYNGSERTSSFHLLAWNNTTETFDTLLSNVTSVISDEQITIYDVDDVETDKVRLVGLGYSNGTGTWNSYTELQLWGWDITPSTVSSSAIEENFIYPNPSKGQFYITNHEGAELQLRDLSGKLVYHSLAIEDNQLINLDLKTGVYLVSLIKEGVYTSQLLSIE